MSDGPVGVGVIGAGVISTRYLTNLGSFPDVDVRFVADIDLDRAAAQAAAFDVPRSGTVDELLADPEVEIVVNLTIPAVHAEVALAAIEAGKDVWSEKPFALDRAAGRALVDRARALGRRVATAPDSFLGSAVQTARRLIEAGEIGEPMTALSIMQTPGPDGWHPNPDFLFQEARGPLFEVTCTISRRWSSCSVRSPGSRRPRRWRGPRARSVPARARGRASRSPRRRTSRRSTSSSRA